MYTEDYTLVPTPAISETNADNVTCARPSCRNGCRGTGLLGRVCVCPFGSSSVSLGSIDCLDDVPFSDDRRRAFLTLSLSSIDDDDDHSDNDYDVDDSNDRLSPNKSFSKKRR